MKTILRFFCGFAFVLCLVTGVAVATATRFVLAKIAPSEAVVTEQILQPWHEDFPPEPSLVDSMPEIFDPEGLYNLDTGNIPQSFKDIEMLEIQTHEYLQENGSYIARPIIPTGYVSTRKEFKFEAMTIANREITFETAEIKGVSYKFIGHFPQNPQVEYCESCELPPDLKGKLTKLKNGHVVAETDADFYLVGC